MNKRNNNDLVLILMALFILTCIVNCANPIGHSVNDNVGPAGPQGDQGPAGPQGPPGPGPVLPPNTPSVGTSCQITQAVCPDHPSIVGSFPDVYNNSDHNALNCLQRAVDYYYWCGMQNSHQALSSNATYTKDGAQVGTLTVGL